MDVISILFIWRKKNRKTWIGKQGFFWFFFWGGGGGGGGGGDVLCVMIVDLLFHLKVISFFFTSNNYISGRERVNWTHADDGIMSSLQITAESFLVLLGFFARVCLCVCTSTRTRVFKVRFPSCWIWFGSLCLCVVSLFLCFVWKNVLLLTADVHDKHLLAKVTFIFFLHPAHVTVISIFAWQMSKQSNPLFICLSLNIFTSMGIISDSIRATYKTIESFRATDKTVP